MTSLFVPLASALFAALFALAGNYWLQNRWGRRIRHAEDLKRRLYEFLSLVTEYWTVGKRDTLLEARILATKLIVMAELLEMQAHSKRLRRWYRDTQECRLDMIDAATGGSFQQEDWSSEPERAMAVAREMGRIVRGLQRAC